MQKKQFLIPLITTIYLSLFIYSHSPIYAASNLATPSASSSASPSAMSDDAITENIKKRLQESLAEESGAIPTLSSARAYIGVIKDVIKDTVIIEDKSGKKDIKLQADTDILRTPGNATIKTDDIRIGDYVIAIGYPDGEETLTGRRLIVSIDPIKPPEKTTGLGKITKINKNSLTLNMSDKDQVIYTTIKTIYKSAVGTIELADLAVGDTLIYTATTDDHDELTATILMRTGTASIAE